MLILELTQTGDSWISVTEELCHGTHTSSYDTMCSDEMELDIFFILFKLTSLEGGIQVLAEFCPSLVHLAIRALVKTQSDEVRTKSLGTDSNPARFTA